MAPRNDSDDGLTSGAGQERRIGHVRGMSAEPSTTEVGVPIGDIGSSNGPLRQGGRRATPSWGRDRPTRRGPTMRKL
jgi:hypothetical protein